MEQIGINEEVKCVDVTYSNNKVSYLIERYISTGLPEEGPRSAAWPSLVFNKIRSLWSAHSSVPQGLNQLTGTAINKLECGSNPSTPYF